MAYAEPTTIVLVRHGESRATVDQIVGGRLGCQGLSTRGRRQSEALTARLLTSGLLHAASALYASTLPRAVETAQVIAPGVGSGNLEIRERDDLCELHVEAGDGLSWSEFGRIYGQPPWGTDITRPLSPGSESWAGFVERASIALQVVAENHPGEMVVVACHGGVIEASFSAWGRVPTTTPGVHFLPENTGMTIWSRNAGPWRLDRYNDHGHLDGQEL